VIFCTNNNILLLGSHVSGKNSKEGIFLSCMASPLLVTIWMRSVGTLVSTNKKKTTASTMTMTSIRTIDLTFSILNR